MKRIMVSLLLLVVTVTLSAQEVVDEYVEHVVEPGDTLERITKKYLGTDFLWRENWKLNPQIKNPHMLRIGQRLKVIKTRTIEAQRALVKNIVAEVDKSAKTEGWVDAVDGDEIGASEGVRTLADSSANLEFNAESTLYLDEYSQVFLRGRETTLRGVDRGTIEVVSGGADLKWNPISVRRPQTELTLVTGSAVTVPRAEASGVSLHAATTDDRSARLSMYEGSGEVEAGGASVNLSKGLGVAVPDGGQPGKPERLLKAPVMMSPLDDSAFNYNNPMLTWEALDNAASYNAEVCADPECAEPLAQSGTVNETRWHAPSLGLGQFYWRVAAYSASGLLGYSSTAKKFSITRDWRDDIGPGVVAEVVGGAIAGEGGELRVGKRSRVIFHSMDDAAGGVVIRFRQGTEWQVWEGEELEPKPGRIEFFAEDMLGNKSPTHSLEVVAD